jgi:hypothetical protein
MKLLIMQFSQPPVTSCLFGTNILGSILSQTPSVYMSFSLCQRPSFVSIQNHRQSDSSEYYIFFDLYGGRENKRFWTECSKHYPNSVALVSLWIKFFFVTVVPKCFLTVPHFQRSVCYLYLMNLLCILMTRQQRIHNLYLRLLLD